MHSSQLDVDWDLIQNAFLQGTWERRYYLDVKQAEVHCVTEQTRAMLQDIYDEVGEAQAIERLDSAELKQAHRIELDDVRYHAVPTCPPALLRQWQDTFSEAADPTFRRLLWTALDRDDNAGFERLLALEPLEQRRWQAELATYVRQQLQPWISQLFADSP